MRQPIGRHLVSSFKMSPSSVTGSGVSSFIETVLTAASNLVGSYLDSGQTSNTTQSHEDDSSLASGISSRSGIAEPRATPIELARNAGPFRKTLNEDPQSPDERNISGTRCIRRHIVSFKAAIRDATKGLEHEICDNCLSEALVWAKLNDYAVQMSKARDRDVSYEPKVKQEFQKICSELGLGIFRQGYQRMFCIHSDLKDSKVGSPEIANSLPKEISWLYERIIGNDGGTKGFKVLAFQTDRQKLGNRILGGESGIAPIRLTPEERYDVEND